MSRSLDCPQLLGERKFPLPGSGLHSRITESVLPSPSPLYFIHIRVCCVWLSPLDFSIASAGRHSSFSHGHPSGNARGGILVLAPARAITREPTHPCVHVNHSLEKFRIKFWNTKPLFRFYQLVLFYFPFPKYLNIFRLWRLRREETFPLRRL